MCFKCNLAYRTAYKIDMNINQFLNVGSWRVWSERPGRPGSRAPVPSDGVSSSRVTSSATSSATVSGLRPWVLMKAIRSGCIIAAGTEGEGVHVIIDDSYADNALTVDLWLEKGKVTEAEIAWEGRRCVTMTVGDFSA